MVKKYSFNEKDILTYPHPDRLIPKTFPKGGGMLRFVTAEDLSFRAGFTKLNKGEYVNSYFWYDELWLVMRGRGQVKTVERPSTKEEINDLKPEDAFYIPKGTHVYVEGTSEDQPLIFFYIAIPASKKEGFWLAHMLPQDIQDVRDREEYHRTK